MIGCRCLTYGVSFVVISKRANSRLAAGCITVGLVPLCLPR